MHMTVIKINIIDNYTGDKYVPSIDKISKWAELCLCSNYDSVIVNLMLVGLAESQKFNINFRSKPGPTNVLSFPYEDNTSLQGDLVMCSPLVIKEAANLKKTEESHWIHLFVHGMLHLQGYDHQNDEEEKEMTSLEDSIIAEIVNKEQGAKA